jgi:hypothetical protein
MANLGTATVKVIPSDTINIPRPGIKHSGATDSNETSTELVPASVVPATTLNIANIGDTVYNTTASTIGLVTGLNYTGTDITSLDTTIDFASGNTYEIYNSYVDSLIPPAVVVGSLLEGIGTLTGSITSAASTDATNGTYNTAAFTTSGTGTGGVINVTVAGNAVTVVTVATIGSGYAAGDTLTVAVGVIGGSTALVITLDDEDITGDATDETQILRTQTRGGNLGIYAAAVSTIAGVDPANQPYTYVSVAGATLPFFSKRVNSTGSTIGAGGLIAFVNND